jgi:hypothetical protein
LFINKRENGARIAKKYGALAALVRSVASYSLDTPHTVYQIIFKLREVHI